MDNNLKINHDLYVKKSDYIELETELQRLEQENERLKAENEQLNKMTGIFSARLCEKYRTTLQEIREIADIIANANCNYVIEAVNIIKKINEVIGEK